MVIKFFVQIENKAVQNICQDSDNQLPEDRCGAILQNIMHIKSALDNKYTMAIIIIMLTLMSAQYEALKMVFVEWRIHNLTFSCCAG